jgi:nickel-dependent lactate racemase
LRQPCARRYGGAAQKFRIDFAVNCIVNNELELAAAFAGGLLESHEAAIAFVRQYSA